MGVEGEDFLAGAFLGADGHGDEMVWQGDVVGGEGFSGAEFGFEWAGFFEDGDFVPGVDDDVRAFDEQL